MEEEEDTLRLTITPPSDRHGLLPEKRTMYLVFRDVEAEEIVVTVGDLPVTVSLTNPRARETDTKEELRSALLTRVQARNLWKNTKFGAKLPKFIWDALAELDAMI